MSRPGRRAERGSTIIEVMIATTLLILAAAGFAGTSQYAASSTGIGHRRTVGTLLRAGLIDRVHVTSRTALRTLSASAEGEWVLDGCWDNESQRLAANTGWAAAFTCPAGTVYRTWINVTDNGGDAWAPTTNTWSVSLYVERADQACTPALRDAAVGCVGADLLLTD
jgi:Tfp pilus assembly protein PilV